jgi:hypothetical protein
MKYLLMVVILAMVGCGKNNGRTPSVENPSGVESVGEAGVGDILEDSQNTDDEQSDLPEEEQDPQVEAPKSPTLPIYTNAKFASEQCFWGKWRAKDRFSYLRAKVKFLESGIGQIRIERFSDEDCRKKLSKESIHFRYEIVKTFNEVVVLRMEEFGKTGGILWLTLRMSEERMNLNWNGEWKLAGPHGENPADELLEEYANCYDRCGVNFSSRK